MTSGDREMVKMKKSAKSNSGSSSCVTVVEATNGEKSRRKKIPSPNNLNEFHAIVLKSEQ